MWPFKLKAGSTSAPLRKASEAGNYRERSCFALCSRRSASGLRRFGPRSDLAPTLCCQVDAVGTAIAGRPPHRTVRAPLCYGSHLG